MSGGDLSALFPGNFGATFEISGRVVAPGAGVAICSFPAGTVPNGVYLVECWFGLTDGAPVVGTDTRNMRVAVDSLLSILPLHPVTGRLDYYTAVALINTVAAVPQIAAVAAATAGVGYMAALKLTRLS